MNPFPVHIDEWNHITQALKLRQGEYTLKLGSSLEFGFHLFLVLISFFTDLVLFYKFLPAIWAVISALVLFYITYRITNKNFLIALFSMIFFASIKSNVNIGGLWFFTPLTFSIPFIFSYIYFFMQGIENQNKKCILISLAIMIFLLFTHAISVLFAVPFLIIYCLFNYGYLKKQYRFFSLFLLVPLIGILFYKFTRKIKITEAISNLIDILQFKHGWGVLELTNSPLEVYSLIGYIFVLIGIIGIFLFQRNYKKYLIYVLWPVILLISIIMFRITGVSYLSPYQRNVYYFAISLPFLSAVGLHYTIGIIRKKIEKTNFSQGIKPILKKIITILIIIVVLFFTFRYYLDVPEHTLLYKIVDEKSYQDLKFLSGLPKAKVLAKPEISTAIYPISGHDIISSIYFYGTKYKGDVEYFFRTQTCSKKQRIIKKHNIKYVLSEKEINCSWNKIYDKNNHIYEVDPLSLV